MLAALATADGRRRTARRAPDRRRQTADGSLRSRPKTADGGRLAALATADGDCRRELPPATFWAAVRGLRSAVFGLGPMRGRWRRPRRAARGRGGRCPP